MSAFVMYRELLLFTYYAYKYRQKSLGNEANLQCVRTITYMLARGLVGIALCMERKDLLQAVSSCRAKQRSGYRPINSFVLRPSPHNHVVFAYSWLHKS